MTWFHPGLFVRIASQRAQTLPNHPGVRSVIGPLSLMSPGVNQVPKRWPQRSTRTTPLYPPFVRGDDFARHLVDSPRCDDEVETLRPARVECTYIPLSEHVCAKHPVRPAVPPPTQDAPPALPAAVATGNARSPARGPSPRCGFRRPGDQERAWPEYRVRPGRPGH